MHKFVPRSRVGIFRNQRTRSTALDPKLPFWCILYYLGAYGTVWLPYEIRCKTGRTSAKVRAPKSHRNFSQQTHRSTPLDPKLTFRCISYYVGAFGTVWFPYETWCKTGRTSEFVPRSCVGIFRNERTRSNSLDPKLTFWCVSYHLGAFGTVWVPYKTWCNTGRTSAKVRATKSRRNFSQQTHPIHPFEP